MTTLPILSIHLSFITLVADLHTCASYGSGCICILKCFHIGKVVIKIKPQSDIYCTVNTNSDGKEKIVCMSHNKSHLHTLVSQRGFVVSVGFP